MVYIIYPSHGGGSLFAPELLLSSILAAAAAAGGEREKEESGAFTRDQAVSLLDNVHLLPVPDVSTIAQAVSQISDDLHRLDQSSRQEKQQQQDVLLILEGLDTLTENLIRSSNPLRGCAMAVPILHTLTYLTRSYADRLTVLVVNGVGLSVDTSSLPLTSTSSSASFSSSSQREMKPVDAGSTGASLIQSVFGGLAVRQPLLSRTMDYGIDVHLLVSVSARVKDEENAPSKVTTVAVEVVKDRVGGFFGEWCFV